MNPNLVQQAKDWFATELQRSFAYSVPVNDSIQPNNSMITFPQVTLQHITPDAEKMSIDIARVSSPQSLNRDYVKLLMYCFRHGHWSVFEHAHMTIEIHTSRTIARQILRHRSFTFQEFSQRYSEVPPEPVVWQGRTQSESNRQGSAELVTSSQQEMFESVQRRVWDHAYAAYQGLLAQGFSKECARCLLPEGMSETRMYMTGPIRSWIHYLNTRYFGTVGKVQQEHIDVAERIANIFRQQLPNVWQAMMDQFIEDNA